MTPETPPSADPDFSMEKITADGGILAVTATDPGRPLSEAFMHLIANLAAADALAELSNTSPAAAELMMRTLLTHLATFAINATTALLHVPPLPILAAEFADQPDHPVHRGKLGATFGAAVIADLYAQTRGDFPRMARLHADSIADSLRRPLEELRAHPLYVYSLRHHVEKYTRAAAARQSEAAP